MRRLLRTLGRGRDARHWPTVALAAFCLLAGIPTTIALTPGRDVVAFGQVITVGARPAQLSPAGPALLVQVGNTALDLRPLTVWGPLRPQLTMGPVQRNAGAAAVFDADRGPAERDAAVSAITDGFVTWYLWAGAGLLAFTLVAAVAAVGIRGVVVLRRVTHAGWVPPADLWLRSVRATRRMTVIALAVSVLAWAGCGALAWTGAVNGLRGVTSLAQLVGAYRLSPHPVGPPLTGYLGAVIGDSRAARLGGPPVPATGPYARPDDAVCRRSTDSLASEIGDLLPARVLNLACPDATVTAGLRGPQDIGGQQVPAQVGVLRQVQGLRFVVVEIGPNDVGWTDFLRYCYGVPDCADALTQNEFDYRLAAFDRAYGDLLVDLNDLPGRPQVIVVSSYGAFAAHADCADTKAAGYPGLDPTKIALLTARNEQLNAVLTAGAEKYGFAIARPELSLLCDAAADGLGPDIQGMADPFPFHPTGIGSLRTASSVLRLVNPLPQR